MTSPVPITKTRIARSLERDLQKAIERELKGLVLQFTHRVPPSVAGFLVAEPAKIKA